MINGVLPSEVSAALRRGTKLVLGEPWDRSFPSADFWRKHRIAVLPLIRLLFASYASKSLGFCLGHDGTMLNKIDTYGIVLQLLMGLDDDELVSISSGPLVIIDQKSATEVEQTKALFVSARGASQEVVALINSKDAPESEKRIALALLGHPDECRIDKAVLIISDFANGAKKTSSDLSELAPLGEEVINCAEHAFENVANACIASEKKFLSGMLAKIKGVESLSKDDKPLVETNSVLYAVSKLLHITTTDTYYLSLGASFQRWFKETHSNDKAVLHRMMRFRGSRFYAGLVNRSVLNRMRGSYVAFLSTLGTRNKIEDSVLLMLRMVTTELAGRSGGLWTDQLIRPGRCAMLKKGRGNVVAAKEFASALITLLTAIEEVRIRPAQLYYIHYTYYIIFIMLYLLYYTYYIIFIILYLLYYTYYIIFIILFLLYYIYYIILIILYLLYYTYYIILIILYLLYYIYCIILIILHLLYYTYYIIFIVLYLLYYTYFIILIILYLLYYTYYIIVIILYLLYYT